MKRAQMSPQERSWRSELVGLIAHQPFLRGTLSLRQRSCGKPNCRCARGEKHASLYLVQSREGRPRQLFLGKEQEEQARQWVDNYQRLRELVERVSERSWEFLQRKEP